MLSTLTEISERHELFWRKSGVVGEGIVIRIGRFPIQTQLGARLGLGSQPHYEAPGDLRVEYVRRSD